MLPKIKQKKMKRKKQKLSDTISKHVTYGNESKGNMLTIEFTIDNWDWQQLDPSCTLIYNLYREKQKDEGERSEK